MNNTIKPYSLVDSIGRGFPQNIAVVRGEENTNECERTARILSLVSLSMFEEQSDPMEYLGLQSNDPNIVPSFVVYNKSRQRVKELEETFARFIADARKQVTGKSYPHNMVLTLANRPLDIITSIPVLIVLTDFDISNKTDAEMLNVSITRLLGRCIKSLNHHLWIHLIICPSDTCDLTRLDEVLAEKGFIEDQVNWEDVTENISHNNIMNNEELKQDFIEATKSLNDCLDKIQKSKATYDFSDETVVLLNKIFAYVEKFDALQNKA